MTATMSDMELIEADTLAPDQLMIGDLIKVNGDILEVTFIESDSTGDNYDIQTCLLYTSPSPRDRQKSRMPSSA